MTDAYGSDINLPGWAEQSVWGYDPLLQCYWAQLWPDLGHLRSLGEAGSL